MNSPTPTAQPDPAAVMRSIIKRIATGLELSRAFKPVEGEILYHILTGV